MASATAPAAFPSGTGPSEPGTTGTPACRISARAAALLPMARITSPEGPIKVIPFSAQASANPAFSDSKP